MKLKIPSGTPRKLRQALVTVASTNSFLLVASVGFKDSGSSPPSLLLIPQINISIITIFYAYFKYRLLPNSYTQLVSSTILAGAYIFFAVRVFPQVDEATILLRVIESINVFVAALLLLEAICTVVVGRAEEELAEEARAASRRSRAERRMEEQRIAANGGSVTVPPAIHIYQPRLDLAPVDPNHRASVISGSSATVVDIDIAIDFHEDVELEELPKYQRKRPAQSATIIDMANLASVDQSVLENVIPRLSVSSSSSSRSEVQTSDGNNDLYLRPPSLSALGEIQEQQERHGESRDEVVPSDTPEYSPRPTAPSSPSPSSSSLSPSSTPSAPLSTSLPDDPSLRRTTTQPPVYVP